MSKIKIAQISKINNTAKVSNNINIFLFKGNLGGNIFDTTTTEEELVKLYSLDFSKEHNSFYIAAL